MGECEADIGAARFGKAGCTTARFFSCRRLFATEQFETFEGKRLVQCQLVRKMSVDGSGGHADFSRQLTQGWRFTTGAFQRLHTRGQKRVVQVSVMVGSWRC